MVKREQQPEFTPDTKPGPIQPPCRETFFLLLLIISIPSTFLPFLPFHLYECVSRR
jgi:hypothetical protein